MGHDDLVSVRYMVDDVDRRSTSTPAVRVRGVTTPRRVRRSAAATCGCCSRTEEPPEGRCLTASA